MDERFVGGLEKIDCSRGGDMLYSSLAATEGENWCDTAGAEVAVRDLVAGGDGEGLSFRRAAASKALAVRGSTGQALSPFHTGDRAWNVIGVAPLKRRWWRKAATSP